MSLDIALSGLNAATTNLNTISNNIANANTTGFKQSRAEFGDFFAANAYGITTTAVGSGVQTERVAQQFGQGTITTTGNSLDMAINGTGLFTLSDHGAKVYTRAGAFGTDSQGYVVNSSGQNLQVYPAVKGGTFNTGALTNLQINNTTTPPSATTSVTAGVNLPSSATAPANATFNASDATSYNETQSVTVYDSLGASHNASLYFVKDAAPGAWTVHTMIDGTETGTGTAVTFDSSGNLATPAGGLVTLPPAAVTTGAAPLALNLNLSSTTQYGDSFAVSNLAQDGYASGQLTGVSVSSLGVVNANYTNGQSTALGQLAIASFPNSQGLQQTGNDSWTETPSSGVVVLGTATTGGDGVVQSGSLESSNVDITQQLVNMITAQRNYQANAQVISTDSKLLDTILNLR